MLTNATGVANSYICNTPPHSIASQALECLYSCYTAAPSSSPQLESLRIKYLILTRSRLRGVLISLSLSAVVFHPRSASRSGTYPSSLTESLPLSPAVPHTILAEGFYRLNTRSPALGSLSLRCQSSYERGGEEVERLVRYIEGDILILTSSLLMGIQWSVQLPAIETSEMMDRVCKSIQQPGLITNIKQIQGSFETTQRNSVGSFSLSLFFRVDLGIRSQQQKELELTVSKIAYVFAIDLTSVISYKCALGRD